jgi:hypothetical protein
MAKSEAAEAGYVGVVIDGTHVISAPLHFGRKHRATRIVIHR